MKIKQPSNKKKIILAILAVVLLAAGSAATYWIINRDSGDTQEGVNLEPATKTEEDAGKQSKDETVNKDTSSNSSKENGASETPATPPSQTTTIPMRITASSQNGDVYQLRTLIEQVVTNGTCTLTLTKSGTKVTKSAPTQALAQSSTCQGFDIPVSELSPGTWQVAISLSGAGITGSTSGTIDIK